MWILLTVLFFAALIVPAYLFDRRRRRQGLPVNGPDGLRGYRRPVKGAYGGYMAIGGGMASGAGAGDINGSDGGGGGSV